MLGWLKDYEFNAQTLCDDLRLSAKALVAIAVANGFYPGDGKLSVRIVVAMLVTAFAFYFVGNFVRKGGVKNVGA